MLQNDSKVKQGTQTGTEKTSSASRIIRRIETFSKKKMARYQSTNNPKEERMDGLIFPQMIFQWVEMVMVNSSKLLNFIL